MKSYNLFLLLLFSFSLFAMDVQEKKKNSLCKIGAACTTINAHPDMINAIACNPKEPTLASCSRSGGIKIWDLETQKCSQELVPDVDAIGVGIQDVAFHPEGKIVASGELSAKLKFWDTSSGKEIFCLKEERSISALNYNQNGSILAASVSSYFSGGDVRLIDLRNNKCKQSYPTDDWVEQVKVTKELLIAGLAHRGLVFWNRESDEVTKLGWRGSHYGPWDIQHGPHFVFTSNAKLAIEHDLKNVVLYYDFAQKGNPEFLPFRDNKEKAFVYALACSPDEKTIAISRCELDQEFITLWDIEKNTTVHFDNGELVNAMEYTPDGSVLITGSRNGKIKLWNLTKAYESNEKNL